MLCEEGDDHLLLGHQLLHRRRQARELGVRERRALGRTERIRAGSLEMAALVDMGAAPPR